MRPANLKEYLIDRRKFLNGKRKVVVSFASMEVTRTVAALAMKKGPSVDFSGCWQRHLKAA